MKIYDCPEMLLMSKDAFYIINAHLLYFNAKYEQKQWQELLHFVCNSFLAGCF